MGGILQTSMFRLPSIKRKFTEKEWACLFVFGFSIVAIVIAWLVSYVLANDYASDAMSSSSSAASSSPSPSLPPPSGPPIPGDAAGAHRPSLPVGPTDQFPVDDVTDNRSSQS